MDGNSYRRPSSGSKKNKSAKVTNVKSAPPPTVIEKQKDVGKSSQEPSIDSRRTSMSSRRASTVPIGITKIRTELRELDSNNLYLESDVTNSENHQETSDNGKKFQKFGYVATFFKPSTEENNSNDVDLF